MKRHGVATYSDLHYSFERPVAQSGYALRMPTTSTFRLGIGEEIKPPVDIQYGPSHSSSTMGIGEAEG